MMKSKALHIVALGLTCCVLNTVAHADTVTYVYTDPQGTPLAEADINGNITATFDYTPYGVVALGTPPNGPGYTGHVSDPETNLIYMHARYYDPATGRFLSVDPRPSQEGDPLGFGLYVYDMNNPLRYNDPDGRAPAPFFFVTLLNLINQQLNNSVQQDYVQPVQQIYHTVDNHAEITQTGVATFGLGLQGTNNVLHPNQNSAALVMGEGANYSVDIAPKTPFVLHLGSNDDPGPVRYGGDFQVGAGLHAGISLSLDTNFNLNIKPKGGIGIGEVVNFKIPKTHVDVAPSVEVELNQDKDGDKPNIPPPPPPPPPTDG